jgi:hypothetical protein
MPKEYKNPKAKVISLSDKQSNVKPENFLKNITDEQFNAAVKKFGFSEADLDNIRKARLIICQLAHGDSPFKHSTVDVTCGGKRCVDPKHLKWAPVRSIEEVNNELSDLLDVMAGASNLDEMLQAVLAFENAVADALRTHNKLDTLPLRPCKSWPTFGGEPPADAVGVLSWDERRLLVDPGAGWEIIDRAKWQGLTPEARAMVECWSQPQH